MVEKAFKKNLLQHLYKTITVYTVSYNDDINFTGTLASVHDDIIILVISLGVVETNLPQPKSKINFNRYYNNTYSSYNAAYNTPRLIKPGSIAEIPISKIAAVIYYPI